MFKPPHKKHEVSADIRFGDCIPGLSELSPDSIDATVTSIPFESLFSYSHKPEDIGNNAPAVNLMSGQFALHMRFFIEELFRVHKPGTVVSIHIQQLLRWKVQHGYMGMRDFRGAVISMFENHGFETKGEVAIVKNPQMVARRLNLHSLMFATAARDSSQLTPANNDYILFFRKPGEREPVMGLIEKRKELWIIEPSPIVEVEKSGSVKFVPEDYRDKPYPVWKYDEKGYRYQDMEVKHDDINPDGWFTKNDWVKWARGAWEDIQEIDTLDGWRHCRENDDEKHVCPLQLEPIRRCVKLFTNPGDCVLDPFMGIGSTAYVALEQGRNAVGFELKESYYKMAVRNSAKAIAESPQIELPI